MRKEVPPPADCLPRTAAARLETLDDRAFAAADTDGNGKVTSADARKILRVAAKLESF